jgi:diketogulonate reductase-like aldo/keto reductase
VDGQPGSRDFLVARKNTPAALTKEQITLMVWTLHWSVSVQYVDLLQLHWPGMAVTEIS